MNGSYESYGVFKYTFPFESKFGLSPKQLDGLSDVITLYLNSLKDESSKEQRVHGQKE